MICAHCGYERWDDHQDEHETLCCDCYDLSWGMSLETVNVERAKARRSPIERVITDGGVLTLHKPSAIIYDHFDDPKGWKR